MLTIYRI